MSTLKLHHMKEIQCPQCGHKLDGAIGDRPIEHGPKKDDFATCGFCAATLRFTDDEGGIRSVTKDDLAGVSMIDKLKMVISMAQVMAMNKGKGDDDGDD
jgi:hypothetical protein